MRCVRAILLAAAASAIAIPPSALYAQPFASLLDLESSSCTVDTHAEVGGNGANEKDGFGASCEPVSLSVVVARDASAHEEESCDGFGGAARSTGRIRLYGGPRGVGSYELWLYALAVNQASGACGFDSRSRAEVHLQWRVTADVELEYQPLFPCESNGRDVTALLTLAGQAFDLREPCPLAPVRVALAAGDLISLDVRLDETRSDNDTELNFAFRLRGARDPGPPLVGLDLDSPRILNTNGPTDLELDTTPEIATDGAGTWLTVWSSTDDLGGTIGGDSDILFARSTDGGRSWSDAAPIADTAARDDASDLRPEVTFDGRDAWVVGWHSGESQTDVLGADRDILYAVSVDGGATWSAPLPLNGNAAVDLGDDQGVELLSDGSGHIVAAWASADDRDGTLGPDFDILVAHSSDGGATWSEATAADPGAASDSSEDTQASLATNGNGDWVLASIAAPQPTGIPGIQVASSRDDAQSWSSPVLANPVAVAAGSWERRPEVAFAEPSSWMLVWHSFDSFAGTIGGDADIVAAKTTDLDAGWGSPFVLDPDADRDSGSDVAPSIASFGSDRFAVVWESNEPALGGVLFDRRVIAISGSAPTGGFSEPRSIVNGPQARGAEARQPALAIGPLGGIVVVWRANALANGTIGPDDDIFFAVPEPGTEWLGPAALLTLLAFRRARMRGSSSRHRRQAVAASPTPVLH